MTLLKFYANWCGPCKMLAPIIEEIAKEEGLRVEAIDVDTFPSTAAEWGVHGVPTTILVSKQGEEIARVVGAKPKTAIKAALSL